jgi:hypothetical protein
MSDTPSTAETLDHTPLPAWLPKGATLPLRVPNPANLRLAEGLGIKAATGVDVADPGESSFEITAALVWFTVTRQLGGTVTIEQIMADLDLSDVEADPPRPRGRASA